MSFRTRRLPLRGGGGFFHQSVVRRVLVTTCFLAATTAVDSDTATPCNLQMTHRTNLSHLEQSRQEEADSTVSVTTLIETH